LDRENRTPEYPCNFSMNLSMESCTKKISMDTSF
jgi:hypothetical protein